MTEAELALVRSFYDVWNGSGPAGTAVLLAPDIVWADQPELPGADTYEGIDAVVAHHERLIADVGHFQNDVQEIIDVGERAVVVARLVSEGPLSGVPIDLVYAHVVDVRDGKIARVRAFFERDQALSAASK